MCNKERTNGECCAVSFYRKIPNGWSNIWAQLHQSWSTTLCMLSVWYSSLLIDPISDKPTFSVKMQTERKNIYLCFKPNRLEVEATQLKHLPSMTNRKRHKNVVLLIIVLILSKRYLYSTWCFTRSVKMDKSNQEHGSETDLTHSNRAGFTNLINPITSNR